MMGHTILEVRGASKFFPGIKALDRVDLTLRSGEVHALIGENGAGKSTLVKVLTGVLAPTAGTLSFLGKPHKFGCPAEARAAGIAVIHQEPCTFPDLTVAENVFLGRMPRCRSGLRGLLGLLDWGTTRARARELLDRVELLVSTDALLRELSVAEQHLVAIARALSEEASLVIMDEPTSALSRRETEDLFRIIRGLREDGRAILFISHKFDELFAIADSYTVLRDGRYVGEGAMRDTHAEELIHRMTGREIGRPSAERSPPSRTEIISVEGFSRAGYFRDISFSLHKGEILGMFGLVGAGRSDLVRSLMGLEPRDAGRVRFKGADVTIAGPGDALGLGIAHVPEDRQGQGLIGAMSIRDNVTLPQVAALARGPFLNGTAEEAIVADYGTRMEIKAASWHERANHLSGGNQQKVVLAKWLATKPTVLILDEPTKGIDIATKAAVHAFVSTLASQGLAILLISSELPELLCLSDRILVLYDGRITARIDRPDAEEATILRAATGLDRTVGRAS